MVSPPSHAGISVIRIFMRAIFDMQKNHQHNCSMPPFCNTDRIISILWPSIAWRRQWTEPFLSLNHKWKYTTCKYFQFIFVSQCQQEGYQSSTDWVSSYGNLGGIIAYLANIMYGIEYCMLWLAVNMKFGARLREDKIIIIHGNSCIVI